MVEPLLATDDVARSYLRGGDGARRVHAVDGVTLTIDRGETLGLVGESGCGKSTLGRLVAGQERPDRGTVRLDGRPIDAADRRAMRPIRRRMQMVFQDPYSSLNPRLTAGDAIAEGLRIHRLVPPSGVAGRVGELLREVGLEPDLADRYPHQFSGGQRQRIGIARALSVAPDLLICDEPVSALDVSVQAQILNLLADLQEQRGLAYLFVAHDLAVVRQLAHRIAVMYLGRIVELAPAESLVATPRHPYTRALRSAVPSLDPGRPSRRIMLPGDPPGAGPPARGCAFAARCFHPAKDDRCLADTPILRPLGVHQVACHHAEEA